MSFPFALDALGWILTSGGRGSVKAGATLDVEGALKLGGTAVTASAAEINSLDDVASDWYTQLSTTPSFTIGTEAGDSINVAVQLNDPTGSAIAGVRVVDAYLSADSGGDDDIDTLVVPDGDVVIGTNGTILTELVADAWLKIRTSASGAFDLDIGEAGAGTWYLTVVVGGVPYTSGAITFS